MTKESSELLLLLPSIHHVMKAEARLLAGGLHPDLVPVPREIASDCGMAVTIPTEEEEAALQILREHALPVTAAYRKIGSSFEPIKELVGEEVAP